MKIEVTCSNCQSVMRVANEHEGKQLRCPTCGTLCNIPISNEPSAEGEQDMFEPTVQRPIDRGQPDPDYKPPVYIGPQSAPLNPDAPVYRPTAPPGYPDEDEIGGRDENLGRSYLVFGLGIASCFVCGCLAFVIAPVLFGKGMEFAGNSNDPSAKVAFLLNAAGMVVWAVILLGIVASFLFG